jgi:hypothetical protein
MSLDELTAAPHPLGEFPLEETKKEEPVFYHNWLYSVVPVDVPLSGHYEDGIYVPDYSMTPYLTGYCRNCNRVFSVPIPTNDVGYREHHVGVEKTGCVGPS